MHPKRTILHDLRDDSRLSNRFWTKVQVLGEADCWEWQAFRSKFGYGKTGVGGRVHFAHRVAWELTYGPIPDGIRVLHRCDNPPCVNPAHLFLGTMSDNMQDMWDKGRHEPPKKQPKPAPIGRARGERHGLAKLTAEIVLLARQQAAAGTTYQALALQHGVTKQAIRYAVLRHTWKHV
jgi:hypothetical protein